MPLFSHGFLRVAVASPRVTVANPAANAKAILELLGQAEQQSVAITVFPELCLTGYTCADLFHQITLQRGAPGETVASATAPVQYRLDHDPTFDTLKVGDQVTLKVDQLNGVPTVTQVSK